MLADLDRLRGHRLLGHAFPVVGIAVIALLLTQTRHQAFELAGPLLILSVVLYFSTRTLVRREVIRS